MGRASIAYRLPVDRMVLPGGFHALVCGDPAARPLLWLHGFPDHPPSALPFLVELARTHRVIAPWLRGYAPSPLDGPYDLDTLANDIAAILEVLGAPVDVVGHDWGAAITYAVCATAPARVRRAVTMALPHPLTFARALRSSAQLRRSWYIALFQLPNAERMVRARELAMIDHLWRAWSPGFALDDVRRAELHDCLAKSLPAPLGYYRAFLRPLTGMRGRMRKLAGKIAVPILQLDGASDGCVLPPDDSDAFRFDERVLEIVPDAGHFLHLEQPEAMAARVAAWLT